jgi:fatty acid desaturase
VAENYDSTGYEPTTEQETQRIHNTTAQETQRIRNTEVRRRGVDVFTLLVGLVALVASSYAITDGRIWLPGLDFRWVIAGGALVVGLLLLAASLRPRRR